MKTNRVIKIFLASSEELEADRYRFGNLIRKLDNIYEKRGIRIELFEWEDYDAAYNGMRKQDEYNERVRASDMFLALFHKKEGKFTIEEFNIARKAFDEQASPKIYTYIKDLEAGESESRELAEFKRLMLEELGHYWCRYSNFDTMQLHFVLQLQMEEATTPIKVEVKESQVKIGDSTIADLNNVPFTSENATHRELQSRKEQLDREIGNAESGGRRGFFGQRSRMTDEELANLREERESVTEQIERQEKALVDTAMSIARMQGGECSPRMRTAAELFEKGETDKAEAVLKEDDMEADATNAKLKFDTAAQPTAELARNIERCAGEYMLKARIVVSGIADESRYRQAVKLMSTAIDLVSGRLPEETLAEYLFDYAVLLADAGQQAYAGERRPHHSAGADDAGPQCGSLSGACRCAFGRSTWKILCEKRLSGGSGCPAGQRLCPLGLRQNRQTDARGRSRYVHPARLRCPHGGIGAAAGSRAAAGNFLYDPLDTHES